MVSNCSNSSLLPKRNALSSTTALCEHEETVTITVHLLWKVRAPKRCSQKPNLGTWTPWKISMRGTIFLLAYTNQSNSTDLVGCLYGSLAGSAKIAGCIIHMYMLLQWCNCACLCCTHTTYTACRLVRWNAVMLCVRVSSWCMRVAYDLLFECTPAIQACDLRCRHTICYVTYLMLSSLMSLKSSTWAMPTILRIMTAPPNFRASTNNSAMNASCAAWEHTWHNLTPGPTLLWQI